ncbi:MAG: hypothetical protein ROO73_04790 [Roseivirga sp.]
MATIPGLTEEELDSLMSGATTLSEEVYDSDVETVVYTQKL